MLRRITPDTDERAPQGRKPVTAVASLQTDCHLLGHSRLR